MFQKGCRAPRQRAPFVVNPSPVKMKCVTPRKHVCRPVSLVMQDLFAVRGQSVRIGFAKYHVYLSIIYVVFLEHLVAVVLSALTEHVRPLWQAA